MRLARTRRSRTAFLLSIVFVLLVLVGWRGSEKLSPKPVYPSYRASATPPVPYTARLGDGTETPLIPPLDPNRSTNGTLRTGLRKTTPSFHLLIPATHSNPNLCKTLLSAFVLSYPPPTLINFGKVFNEDVWGEGSHIGKIRGVYEFLNDEKKVKDDDLVMITDGYDVWFQLPPEVLIERYHAINKEANERLRGRYGNALPKKSGASDKTKTVQRYTQKIVFAADKICWPNLAEDPACAAVPYSTLPKNVYGPETDNDPISFLIRPRYLNSGTLIGPVAEVRRLYDYALKKLEELGGGIIGDQFVFAEVFGEQEYQREIRRKSSQGTGGRWLEWLSDRVGMSESPLSANITINNMTAVLGRDYEFSVGLDYESNLFQTMTHSAGDIDFITYNDSALLSQIQDDHPSLWSHPLSLPADLQRANPPFSYASPGNHSDDLKDGILLPFSPNLDMINQEPTWHEVPLATNLFASSIPSLLHFNGDTKPLIDEWWSSMWYYPTSRALLRRYMRSINGKVAAKAAAEGGSNWWDTRGGQGGVWTDRGTWIGWGEVCAKTENEVFADGKGVWSKENGESKVVNDWGKVVSGGDAEDDIRNDA